MSVANVSSSRRSKLGLAVLLSCLAALPGCAKRGTTPVQAPLYSRTNPVTPPPFVPVVTVPAQPRVILAAPPLASAPVAAPAANSVAGAPQAAPVAPPLPAFTPRDSPLLAAFDSKPHGESPKIEPEFAPRARNSGWQIASYPSPYYYGAYGYPGWGSYYGYTPYWGYPRVGLGVGLGLGYGLGVGFGRPYYGGYYGRGYYGGGYGGYHGHHGMGYGGGHAHVTGGHAGRHH
ncbi:MAG: hypothetical protein QM778_03555 [Myxococcales bacterium]